ncbi:GDCCVxC domain-containing (seleno)protein [Nitrosomonas sp.]|uniref:GDCCVxC domain-containing (seleno)protein n=1 Tax=Nitrosomonas sp. TaxID=42353 RepID=UPI002849F9F7|nr:GDCCVxC domain-containing (seleno)protein [Nitrosomonas sp.]MDR4513161.1 hypothetical protein [Nitrosomonas sp.]
MNRQTGKMMNQGVILESEIKCPECGYKKVEKMPTEFCQWFYECEQCHTLLKPLAGDCCVFCSYGSVPCPPIQLSTESKEGGCCSNK